MIITKKCSSSKSLKAWLEEPETHELYDITAIDWVDRTARCETKPISVGKEERLLTRC